VKSACQYSLCSVSRCVNGSKSCQQSMIVAFCSVIVSQNVCRCSHSNTLVKFEGTVTKRERQVHDLQVLYVTCSSCGFSLEPFAQAADRPSKPKRCPHCQSRGPFEVTLPTLVPNHLALMCMNFVLVQLTLAAQCNIFKTKFVVATHARGDSCLFAYQQCMTDCCSNQDMTV